MTATGAARCASGRPSRRDADPATRHDTPLIDVKAVDVDTIVDGVLAWGSGRLRDLPWRRTRDPWAVLTSEIMLQQTQVGRVLDRWPRFLSRFPTPAACADASLAEVLAEWSGLGYPRRAKFLHETATAVAAAGRFPDTLADLLALPGVGNYTARAVMVFAFERDEAVVDTNIARIYARIAGRGLTPAEVQGLADIAVPMGEGWAWNQILMDLGATVCTARRPHCDECPVAEVCLWRGDLDRPDPARRSAHVSKPQARFEGSDRQARGRLMAALTTGPVARKDASTIMNRSEPVAHRLVADLIDERLCSAVGDTLVLGEG